MSCIASTRPTQRRRTPPDRVICERGSCLRRAAFQSRAAADADARGHRTAGQPAAGRPTGRWQLDCETRQQMPSSDLPTRTVPPDTDVDARAQDSSGKGRGIGLGFSTVIGALLIAIPVIWAIAYLSQAGSAGLGGGFAV